MSDLKQSAGNLIKDLPTWAKGLIAISIVGGVIYVGVKVYKKVKQNIEDKKEETKESGNVKAQVIDNFNNIPTYIGAGAVKSPKGDAYVVQVESGNKTLYDFNFYSNGRVFIYNDKTKVNVAKGKYFDSGKIIYLDNGKSFQYNSVWMNMQNVLKGLN